MPETLVLLHGFAATRRTWDRVASGLGERYRPLALDLSPERGFDGCVKAVLAASPARFALCGYSMGGRIAQIAALAAPSRVTRLVLVATTAGIDDAADRERRRLSDERLARLAESEGVEAFARHWMAQPLFAGTPDGVARLWHQEILRCDSEALAAGLRLLGTGSMTPLWPRLAELDMPVTVVVGERDAKYRGLGERLVAALPRAELVVIAGAGHGIPREAPEALAAVLDG